MALRSNRLFWYTLRISIDFENAENWVVLLDFFSWVFEKKNPKLWDFFWTCNTEKFGISPIFLNVLSIFARMQKVEFFAWVWIFPFSYHTEWPYFYFYWQDAGVETLPSLGLKRAWCRWPTRKRLVQGSRMDRCPCLPSPPTSSPLSSLSVTTLPCQSWESHCHQVCQINVFFTVPPRPPNQGGQYLSFSATIFVLWTLY